MEISPLVIVCAISLLATPLTCEDGLGEQSAKSARSWSGWNQYPPGGGGGLPYENDGDARRKIRINTLKETNLGVAPALFNP